MLHAASPLPAWSIKYPLKAARLLACLLTCLKPHGKAHAARDGMHKMLCSAQSSLVLFQRPIATILTAVTAVPIVTTVTDHHA